MFLNAHADGEAIEAAGRRRAPLQPIDRLCILRTRDCELTAFWRPSACAWSVIEVDRGKRV